MTQKLKSYAYKLEQDIDHIEKVDWEYDLELDVSQTDKVRSLSTDLYEIECVDMPNPLKFRAEMSSLIMFDYPYSDYLDGSIISKKMLEVLQSVKPFGCRTYPIEIIDWKMTPPRDFTVPNNYDYVLVQLTEYTDVFDYEKSVYTKRKYTNPRFDKNGEEEWFVSNVEEFAFHTPKDGFPPIFRVEESSATLFVSDEARQALKEAKITGIEYQSLQGIAYGEIRTEIDVFVDFPSNFDERTPLLRKALGV
jgi:hypothetical protein